MIFKDFDFILFFSISTKKLIHLKKNYFVPKSDWKKLMIYLLDEFVIL